ncbi:uncharacterized protein LAJ45_08698 [Morchella importuna]|uniref:uncharacterized protein n=1 Tax=Morchella importuna TaxID=1174673 RepID=UPI001E8E14D2|nr:uncharacterized protein LAJ45_08698 [Morchella importuna]KAH8147220.1 hypothetical protein LAJ45_08698 [Morchella importuna]
MPETQRPPLTPEAKRRIETNRLKAKAIREARLAAEKAAAEKAPPPPTIPRSTRSTTAQKRSYAESSNVRDTATGATTTGPDAIKPARKFARRDYIDYDFSRMTDTKGGFLSTEDDPHSALAALDLQNKPAHMTLEQWSAHQLRAKLQKEKAGAYEPAISSLQNSEEVQKCYECESPEIDWKWLEVFGCRVCSKCKDAKPEKYSLLTKTEAREDYLLTDPELRDEELLPHLERPNPHRSTWNNMMLYLRYQVEAHAIKKWGGLEALDKEFEKRTEERKKRKDDKFRGKLRELKKKTRVESWRKNAGSKHEHVWGTAVTKPSGEEIRTCEECGFEVEELVF